MNTPFFACFSFFWIWALLSSPELPDKASNLNASSDMNNSSAFSCSPTLDSLLVFEEFIPSGWMGDGEDPNRTWLDLDESSKIQPHSGVTCVKVTYRRGGTKGFAGIYWQNQPDNWCKGPGEDFSKKGYTRITFWARGEVGGELVEFKAGGIKDCSNGGQFKDSFVTKSKRVTLETNWREYTIDLTGKDLKSVIGGFCWSAPMPAEKEITFYIDEVCYR